MRRLLAVVVAAALLLVVAAPALAGRPYVVKIFAMAGWTATGIPVAGGDRIPIAAKGYVLTAPVSAHLAARSGGSGPAGQVGGTCADAYQWVDTAETGFCGVDAAYFGELIAKAGDTTWAVGDASELVVPDGASGVLMLAANDFMLTTFDNQGSFTVAFGG